MDWENALAGLCVAGMFYVYAAVHNAGKRAKSMGKTLVGVVRTPVEVYRLVRRLRSANSAKGRVDVFQAQQCKRKPSLANRRRQVEYSRQFRKVASFPLSNLGA